jgi:hypothetical protein
VTDSILLQESSAQPLQAARPSRTRTRMATALDGGDGGQDDVETERYVRRRASVDGEKNRRSRDAEYENFLDEGASTRIGKQVVLPTILPLP